jgi:acyl transferase domain-containing protein/NADPH:quinone reductase-like Zn-dependent oxidoreductase/NAD(P)-dependent dehydrogenase (short-subunit alcohol dehydrogenase family)/SAM-dependent methyltransferase
MSAALTPLQKAFLALQDAEARIAALEGAQHAPIAIIGLGCRTPGGVRDGDSFWRLLAEGRDAVGPVPRDRWDHDALYDANPDAPGKIATSSGGFVEDIDQFDPEFFGISPREADGMDPQQRMLLEVCWETLENAGQAPDRLQRTQTGVYVGAAGGDYAYLQMRGDDLRGFDAHFASGIGHSVLSGRISYLLGLQGPSITIDTACSSSLVAIHLACQALRNGECKLALAGGVNLILSPDIFVALSHARMLSPDGRCKTFDASANGFGRGEGCAVVALKLLADAEADGDRVLAIIRGSAVNQDGPSSGLTVPNGPAQEAVVRAALRQAQIEPRQVSYIEAHGTGTELGDPLEVRALGAVFGAERKAPLLIGSVKTNLGHLEAAAGAAGLIKLVLSLQNDAIPKHLHFSKPSPHIAWNEFALSVPTQLTPWPQVDGRRIGGVSSFGFSGTNVHIVLEGADASAPRAADQRPHLAPISADSAEALAQTARAYSAALTDDMRLADVGRTLTWGRAHRAHRAVLQAGSITELRNGLNALADGETQSTLAPREPPRIAFLFTGQGSQYAGMAAGLYEAAPAFRTAFDRCDESLTPILGASLRESVLNSTDAAALEQTALAQPAIFSVEYALAEWLRTLGVTPVAVMGHSIGEIVAACVAGAIELPDALKLVAARGALMQSLPSGGAMAAVFAPEKRVSQAIAAHKTNVAIAAVNGPVQTVISGTGEAVEKICAELAADGIKTHALAVSHAFHSPLMEPIMSAFEREVAKATFSAPRVRLISNVTGQRIEARELASPKYWSRHLREPVRFADGLATLASMKIDLCIEIGPHPALTAFANGVWEDAGPRVIPTLRRKSDDWRSVLDTIGALYLAGAELDWRGLDPERLARPLALPTSQFKRRRHWFKRKAMGQVAGAEHPLLGKRMRSAMSDVVQFESVLDSSSAAFIADHVVQDRIIMPAAGMIEMALSASRRVSGEALALESLVIAAPLVFERDAPRLVQMIVRVKDRLPAAFEIWSAAMDAVEPGFVLHAQGDYAPADAVSAALPAAIGARTTSAEAHYEGLARRGLTFGESLKGVTAIRADEGVATGSIACVSGGGYDLHPATLDACLQIIAAALPENHDQTFLPVTVDRITLLRSPEGTASSTVMLRDVKPNLIRADLSVSDALGLALRIEGVTLRPAASTATSDLYTIEWREVAEDSTDAAWAPSPDDLNRELGGRLSVLAREHGLDAYQASFLTLERLTVQWIARMLDALGWRPRTGERANLTELTKTLGIAPRYHGLLRRYLDILIEDGVLRRDGDAVVVLAWPNISGEVSLEHGGEPRTDMSAACGAHLAEILTGREDPLQRLFPNGSSYLAEKLYRESPEANAFNQLLGETVARIIAKAPPGRKVRILEVGAGTGGTTTHVAPLLKDANVSYCFTDIGPSLVARAKDGFAAYPFMSFQRFDLEADAQAQGFAGESFDIIVAANCIHATADLKDTLGRLRALLAPGGELLLMEVTGFERWIDITFGLTEGWWRFTDFDLRPHYPLLDSPSWRRLLEGMDFEVNEIGQTLPTSRESLIVARKSAQARAKRVALVGGPAELTHKLAAALERGGHEARIVAPEAIDASYDAIAYLGFLNAEAAAPFDALRTVAEPLIAAIKRLGSMGAGEAQLCIVSRGGAGLGEVAPVQSAVSGFARTLALEHAELRPAVIDLDAARPIEAQLEALAAALLSRSAEAERALRDGKVMASRLAPLSAAEPAPVRLIGSASGVLDELALKSATRTPPGPGQVEIRVTASGLNFRELMNALAMRDDADPLGGECAGVVSAVGPGASGFSVGDAVVATALGTFATYVIADVGSVALRPRGVTDAQAAAVPLVAMTAHHALVDLARLRPGQSVLIHAAAGGVGMAAMQIAKRCGARIFATAGNDEKRALLREMGAEAVYSSRTLEFEKAIAEATSGRGVDVVLNSLSGDFIAASVRCLATGGAFVEIGKKDIWTEARFSELRSGARYFPLDLSQTLVRDRPSWDALFNKVIADLASGALTPLPVRTFPLERAAEAFAHMSHARHIGKIVLTQQAATRETFEVDPDGLYLITGGLGGLGLATAERLFERGARGFALIGRSAPDSEAAAKLASWRAAGADVLEIRADISSSPDVDRIFSTIDAAGRPLRGVIHSAGALSDGALLQQDWARFETPLKAKVRGAWLLHEKVRDRRLDLFVLYSSIAAAFGSAGQANHALANSYMDGLARYRRERGLPAVSIAWGAWSEFGAAAVRGVDAKVAASGVGAISPKRGLGMLETLLAGAPPHVVATPMDWSAYLSRWAGAPPPFFSEVAQAGAARATAPRESGKSGKDADFLKRLDEAAPSAHHDMLATFVASIVQRVLGRSEEIDRDKPLNEMGLDSLLAVELRNRLGVSLGLSPGLPATIVFDCPTVEHLAAHLGQRFAPAASDEPAPQAASPEENIDEMSDEEIDAMFDRMAGN